MIGDIIIGDNASIGTGVDVVKDAPSNNVVTNPARTEIYGVSMSKR